MLTDRFGERAAQIAGERIADAVLDQDPDRAERWRAARHHLVRAYVTARGCVVGTGGLQEPV